MAAHKTCIGCKHISSRKCGYIVKIRGSSGAVGYTKQSDERCSYGIKAKSNNQSG